MVMVKNMNISLIKRFGLQWMYGRDVKDVGCIACGSQPEAHPEYLHL